MTINITIDPEKGNVAKILTTKEGKTTSKIVPLDAISDAFKNLIPNAHDTGYITKNLLRELVVNTSCRAFYFPEYVTDFKYQYNNSVRIKPNKYGIEVLNNFEGRSDSVLFIPRFVFKNILGFISNSNTTAFNPSFYQVYSVVPNIFGEITDDSTLVRFFPNQFTDYICWPSGFDTKILKNRDAKMQSTFVTQYLSARFNNDLFNVKLRHNNNYVQENLTEINNFFMEVTGKKSEEVQEASKVLWFYLLYFFLTTVKNIEPAVIVPKNDANGTLGSLFNKFK